MAFKCKHCGAEYPDKAALMRYSKVCPKKPIESKPTEPPIETKEQPETATPEKPTRLSLSV